VRLRWVMGGTKCGTNEMGGERSGGAEGRWDYGGAIAPISFVPHFVPPIAPRGDYGEGLSPPPPPPLC
jgi:hypothetical protein